MTATEIPAAFIGQSETFAKILTEIDCAARSNAKVLITGETGVGKELAARLIHQRSRRSSASLVTLNCAGLPDSLLESELFGHVRGSFTGAYRDKHGLLEMAPHGTVFLDEVGEMTARMQVVLLRFLETGEIQRIGDERARGRVDVRLITATNRDLQSEIQAGRFREDLYFRLNVIRISIPPLRERADDIPALVLYYLQAFSRTHAVTVPTVQPDAMDAMLGYRWPGNIRELKNVLERVVLRTGGAAIRAADLPPEVVRPGGAEAARAVAGDVNGRHAPFASRAEELVSQMTREGESFWSAVHPAFMSRDLTRGDLRKIVQMGLENTNGNYRLLVQLFNMASADYKRFLSFLRKHDCHLSFQRFRVPPVKLKPPAEEKLSA